MSVAALTIAGTDSSGGAGVIADAKTFAALGVWAMACVTAVTAQSSAGVLWVSVMPADLVAAQLAACAGAVSAVKTGMLGSADVVRAVAAGLPAGMPLVVDPVVVSSSGTPLLTPDGVVSVRDVLVPRATVVTPNAAEAFALTGVAVVDRAGQEEAARALVAMGAGAALVTGGHVGAAGPEVADCLVIGSGPADAVWLSGSRLAADGTHGTGCVLSAAVCAGLAQGAGVEEACRQAVVFVRSAIGRSRFGSVDPTGKPPQ